MSSEPGHSANHGDEEDHSPDKKRHRVQRACDMCRIKRVRCEGGSMLQRACNNCVARNYECTYSEAAKKVTSYDRAYIESLQARLAEMEALVKKLAPEYLAGVDQGVRSASSFVSSSGGKGKAPSPPSRGSISPKMSGEEEEFDPSDDEFSARQTIDERFKTLSLDPGPQHFFGKSSSFMMLQKAVDIEQGYTSDASPSANLPGSPEQKVDFHWGSHPWMKSLQDKHTFEFPPDDLIPTLTHFYFSWYNTYLPLLHRPTFEQAVSEGLHLRDQGFASVLLLVCALGARFSDDPRVLLPEYDDWHSAGWHWFHQASAAFQLVNYAPPRLYDLQIACLISHFLHGSSSPYTSWPVVGVGLRLAVALGAHRRKTYDAGPSVHLEQMKRAFWLLVNLDRNLSSALGRPAGIQNEDFDVDLLLECDDEYWLNPDPTQAFKQPPGRPARVAFFNSTLRLGQIHGFALRTIYSINKSKASLGHTGADWEEKTVAELDSALNNFIDSIPDHLRWNPHQENVLFLNQSSILYAQYYSLQMTVHRPFIPSPRNPSKSSLPSLAICTNAARACIHVLDVQYQRVQQASRSGTADNEFLHVVAPAQSLFSAGMVLLMNIWGSKRAGVAADYERDLSDVRKAMVMLEAGERRLYAARKLREVLEELTSANTSSPMLQQAAVFRKRPRPASVDEGSQIPVFQPQPQELPPQRPRELPMQTISSLQSFYPNTSSPSGFVLPTHGQDLGRLPVHPAPLVASGSTSAPSSSIPSTSNPPLPQPQPQPQPPQLNMDFQRYAQPYQVTPDSQYSSSPGVYSPSGYYGQPSPIQPPVPIEIPGIPPSNPALDQDTLTVWSTAPTGFGWQDWGNYFTQYGSNQGWVGGTPGPEKQ